MTDDRRAAFLDRIRAHIASAGHHVTLVRGSDTPRSAYTIGRTEADSPELVLAGTASLSRDQVLQAIAAAAARLDAGPLAGGATVDVPGLGAFALAPVHRSWAEQLLLGVYDYYGTDTTDALQLVPPAALRTIDVPDLSAPFDPAREPVWRWLTEPWDLPIPADTITMTDHAALHGAPIATAARWEADHYELFAAALPDVATDAARAIPLATLLASDPTLEPVTRLAVGEAIRRDPPGPWEPWR